MSSIKNSLSQNFFPTSGSAAQTKDAAAPNAKDSRDPKMLEAAKGFENQFVRQMISEMRKTVPKDDLIPESMADGIFKDQMDDNYAEQWVNQGGIGLTDLVYSQLDEKYGHHAKEKVPLKGEYLNLKSEKTATSLAEKPKVNVSSENTPGSTTIPLATNPNANSIREQNASSPEKNNSTPQDLFDRSDKELFMVKKTSSGFEIKSREPLPENVSLRAPLSGTVLQSAILPDGRQAILVQHDQGLVSQFIHSGKNKVQAGIRVVAGEVIADLPASQNGEFSRVFFGLRKAAKVE